MKEEPDGDITKIMDDVVSIKIHNTTIQVPRIFDDLFEYIKSNIAEGIFRVSGSARRMRQYYGSLSEYEQWIGEANVNDVCGLFKKILYSSLKDAFTVKLCEEIKVLYMEYIREVEMEEEKLLSANESSDESFSTAQTTVPTVQLERIARKLSQLLIGRSPDCKNHLFLYVIHKLHYLQEFVDITKMTTTNFAIVFQPLIYTGDLHELILFQKLLYMLINNSDEIVYVFGKTAASKNIMKYSEIEQHPFFASSMASVEELQSYDENTTNFSRRKSLSNRLSVLLTNYYAPASKHKLSIRQAVQSKESVVSNEEDGESRNSVAPLSTAFTKSKEDLCSSIESFENGDIFHLKSDTPTLKNPNGLKSTSSYFSTNKSRDSLFQIMDNINKEANTRSTENFQEAIKEINKEIPRTLETLIVEESNVKKERRKSILNIFKNPKASFSTGELPRALSKSSSEDLCEEKKIPSLGRNKSIFRRSFSLKIKSKK